MMPKGQSTVVGTLDISQFWPATKGSNSSDGDTVHLKVDPATSFLFSASPRAKPNPTQAYTGAYVIDQGRKKNVITSTSEIKIRLQGIDTPELHYPVIGAWHRSRNVDGAKLPDGGALNIPKIFRRQATFWTQVAGPLTGAEFSQKLQQGLPKKADAAYRTSYFLQHIDALDPRKRIKLATKIGAQGQTLFKPEDLVFKEDPTTLFAANGRKVTA